MGVDFQKTYWTVIQRAIAESKTALNLLAKDYGPPVRNFIRRNGFSEEDAEDLSQEVLLTVCSPEFLRQADQTKGKFRSFVLLVAKNVMNGEWRKRYAKKRKGKVVSLDGDTIHGVFGDLPQADASFDREWDLFLLNRALNKLKKAQPERYEILRMHKIEGKAHAEIAQALKLSLDKVNNEVRAGKKQLESLILEQVRTYCSSQQELDEEITQLKRTLTSGKA